jgi:LCP family protein required for cell wall assembly
MRNIDNIPSTSGQSRTVSRLNIILLVAFGIAALLVGYLTYVTVRDFISSWEITNLPGVSVQDATPAVGEDPVANPQVPLQEVGGPTPPAWDGAKRVTVLVMGLDYRDWSAGEGPPRTDTMILFTIDPITRTAGMISIPRDLWVNIPGYNYGRINTAYQLGEAYQVPGGGSGLAMDTVEELLGVPIDYYAQIDFGAFVDFIDTIKGVSINIPEQIRVDPINPGRKNNTKLLKPGIQTVDGDLALAYARARKSEGGDFDRAARQQQVIMAIKRKVLSSEMLPTLIARAGVIYNQLSAGIHTNLNLDQAIRLAWLASQIDEKQISKGIIAPPDMVTLAVSPDGQQQVLKPITEKIRELRDQIFGGGPVSPAAVNMSLPELISSEAARVEVLNGSSMAGLATRTTDYLKSQGVNVTQTGNGSELAPATKITLYNGKPYTLKLLVELLKISPFRIYYVNDPNSQVDISVTLGEDWATSNPMPAQ